jgi:hypothetical protein
MSSRLCLPIRIHNRTLWISDNRIVPSPGLFVHQN